MSADNWVLCPQCTARLTNEIAAGQAELDAAYGKVTLAEFDAMRAVLDSQRAMLADPTARRTYREDWEVYGADEGTVTVDYRGWCKTCGLAVKFVHAHPFEVTA